MLNRRARLIGCAVAVCTGLSLAASASGSPRVYFSGDVAGLLRQRPHYIHLTSDQNIRQISWSTWGGISAHGQGTMIFSAADNLPPAPLRLILFHRTTCGRHLQYLYLRVTYASGKPPGERSSYVVHYSCG
jgi:hypothetical protein